MRVVPAIAAIGALAFAQAAWAGPVSLSPIAFSPEFQTALDDELGAREGEVLQAAVERAVADALAERGATISASAPVTIDISIIDADPNRPTMEQLRAQPGLDPIRSISIGGAELRAVLRGGDGGVLGEVTHRRYNITIEDVRSAMTWSEARRAIRQFADKVADAYVATGS